MDIKAKAHTSHIHDYDDFINQIPNVILQRGQSYLKNRYVLELNNGINGTLYVKVEGKNGNYEIEIETDNAGITIINIIT